MKGKRKVPVMAQMRMPFVEALEAYAKEKFVPFHTPGHKLGQGASPKLRAWLENSLPLDLGVMYALDDLHEPEGSLAEAQALAADLYGAEYTWFSINGTTALIEAMILGTVTADDEIIIPREAHRSVMGGLILSGAKPVYLPGCFDTRWGVTVGTTVEEVRAVIKAHPKAKAILLVYPNYYGIGIDIEEIVAEAHRHGLAVLVDEAHGAHLPFSEVLPIEALAAGADAVAQSTHKLAGSLTQTSMLHIQGKRLSKRRFTQAFQILQSTSPHYVFLASLDIARHQLAMEGDHLVGHAVQLAKKLRRELREIPGIAVPEQADFAQWGIKNFDCTKVMIDFSHLGLNGREAETRLRAKRIEVELIQANHVLVLITIGDTETSIAALVEAVREISDEVRAASIDGLSVSNQAYRAPGDAPDNTGRPVSVSLAENIVSKAWVQPDVKLYEAMDASDSIVRSGMALPEPVVRLTPREAFQSERRRIAWSEALGRISAETITYYPPGIPFLSAGEEITPAVLGYVKAQQVAGFVPNGAADKTLQTVLIVASPEAERETLHG